MGKKSRIDKALKLTQQGWRLYEGKATASVYNQLGCGQRQRGRARWMARGNELKCIGCSNECVLNAPFGFQLPLPGFRYPAPPKPKYNFIPSPQELLKRKLLLNVDEAAYILNISARKFRSMIHEGKIMVTKDQPMRVKAEDVKKLLEEIDFWESEGEKDLDEKARSMMND